MKKIIFFTAQISEIFSSYLKLFQKNNFETRIFELKKPKNKISYLKEIAGELKKFKPDFVYINDEFFSQNTLLIVLLKKIFNKKTKIISFIADRYIPKKKSFKLKFLLKNIDFIFCRNFKEMKKIKEKDFFRNYSKLHQIYWGLPKELFFKINQPQKEIINFPASLKKIYHQIQDMFVLGFVGRISPEKGIINILEALKKLPENITFLYVGQIDDLNYQKQLSDFIKKNRLEKRVYYLGFIENPKLKYFYNAIDLLILPTTKKYNPFLEELFGAVLAEAMLCQTLVIGSDNGAIPEVIGRSDLIFKEDNSEDLLRVINYIYNLELVQKQKIINDNYNQAINKFTSEKFVQKIIKTII